jgi:hypothetical protein
MGSFSAPYQIVWIEPQRSGTTNPTPITKEITMQINCFRCGQERWPTTAIQPYTCQRCREVLAGGNAIDPARNLSPTPAQEAARKKAAARLAAQRHDALAHGGVGVAREHGGAITPLPEAVR